MGLLIYHPSKYIILQIATIEMTAETTRYIGCLWKNFNEILSNVNGQEVRYNQKMIMVDKAGQHIVVFLKNFNVTWSYL